MDTADALEGDRVVVITGAANGMGLACAERFLETGSSVGLIDKDYDGLAVAAEALGGDERLHIAPADVTSRAEAQAAIESIAKTLGRPAALINAAGVLRGTEFLKISDDEWDLVVGVSLRGAFVMSQACLPYLCENPGGRIVNFSSTAGKTVSTLGGAHYTAAKSGLLGLTRAMAKEFAAFGVTVNAVCPGLIDTRMVQLSIDEASRGEFASSFPIPRLGEPGEVAALVEFLCSPDAAYITGAAVDINGGDLMV